MYPLSLKPEAMSSTSLSSGLPRSASISPNKTSLFRPSTSRTCSGIPRRSCSSAEVSSFAACPFLKYSTLLFARSKGGSTRFICMILFMASSMYTSNPLGCPAFNALSTSVWFTRNSDPTHLNLHFRSGFFTTMQEMTLFHPDFTPFPNLS